MIENYREAYLKDLKKQEELFKARAKGLLPKA